MSKVSGVFHFPGNREVELDFIRGIAILLVIDYHSPGHSLLLAPFLLLGMKNFGWAGVDVFFVLSGFLVGGLLVKEWAVRGSIRAKRFLIRRGFKIWPQYYVFIIVGLLVGHRKLSQQWGNLLNLQNYLGGIAHTWTLAVEEHAYLLLVFILAVAARRKARMRHVFFLLLSLAAAVLLNRLIESRFTSFDTFTHTDTRVDGIFYGVLLAILYHFAPQRFERLQRLRTLWFGIVASTLIYLRFVPQTPLSVAFSWFLADMSGVAVLMLFYRHADAGRRPALYRMVATIGLYSYGIYLWHVSVNGPVVSVAHRMPVGLSAIWLALGPYLLGIPLGIVFTRLVEFPALTLRDRLFPRSIDSAAGIPAEIESETGVAGETESVFNGLR